MCWRGGQTNKKNGLGWVVSISPIDCSRVLGLWGGVKNGKPMDRTLKYSEILGKEAVIKEESLV